ncbi:hypothetical protein [Zavarzinia sp. CC-PAN008]|uniref:hypothetical protein n=1 Tax=Zavarzinia sp. CC-PAN008 TaxID=3243332 RepID=UPI003F748EAA
MKHVPLPPRLAPMADPIRRWASGEKDVEAVYLHGARVTGIARDSDPLDLALALTGYEADDIFAGFLLDGPRWQAELSAATGLPVMLSIAHPELRPKVWRALHVACVPVYVAAP